MLPPHTIPRYTPDGCCPRYLLRDRQVSLLFLLESISVRRTHKRIQLRSPCIHARARHARRSSFRRPVFGHALPGMRSIPYLHAFKKVSLHHGSDRNRTCDLLLAKQMLPQLSYAPKRKPPMSFSFLIDGVLLCLWFLPDPSTSSMDTMISRRMLRLNILLIPCKAIIRAHANKPSSGAVIFHDVDILYQSQHFYTSFPKYLDDSSSNCKDGPRET